MNTMWNQKVSSPGEEINPHRCWINQTHVKQDIGVFRGRPNALPRCVQEDVTSAAADCSPFRAMVPVYSNIPKPNILIF